MVPGRFTPHDLTRRTVLLTGTVQGVGFRPFVHGLATELGLSGSVRNDSGGVVIEVQGPTPRVERFLAGLRADAPPLARIERMDSCEARLADDRGFRITTSAGLGAGGALAIAPDTATCDRCLEELLDPLDRRHGYAFTTCVDCGPRLTIATGSPFDRERTTMAIFRPCAACQVEYEDPGGRRFHAQTIACPECGPRLALLDSAGAPLAGDPLRGALAALAAGRIVAVKGLGGFHLACDAGSEAAVSRLRARKGREAKPFAVMVRDLAEAERLCTISAVERDLLVSGARPIVLLARRAGIPVAAAVAGDNPLLGIMLPYTPRHHLLLRGAARPLVMTSGNRSDEPIAIDDREAKERLSGVADLFLTHDQPIALRSDDSVARVLAGDPVLLRRSRGECPRPLQLPLACVKPTLAVGGQLKVTFALGQDHHAYLGPHIGDLGAAPALRCYQRALAQLESLAAIRPEVIAHDLHPSYASTEYAIARANEEGQRLIAVQHHHAHLASCMAEHALDEPVIGVTFDGTGYGADGTIWGGEFLVGDYRSFRRAAHLRSVPMPGGEAAVREPWRMAVAYLLDAGVDIESESVAGVGGRIAPSARRTLAWMIERGVNAPLTSSMGRLFDAVAALLGVRDRCSYEAQAAIELEWLAAGSAPDGEYPYEIRDLEGSLSIDVRPLIRAIAREAQTSRSAAVARRFHETIAALVVDVCARIRAANGPRVVALSGGVFLNALLTEAASLRLARAGFRVYRHRRVPPGDGGLCLGQLAIAAAAGGE